MLVCLFSEYSGIDLYAQESTEETQRTQTDAVECALLFIVTAECFTVHRNKHSVDFFQLDFAQKKFAEIKQTELKGWCVRSLSAVKRMAHRTVNGLS